MLDRAGWPTAAAPQVRANVTSVLLPPKSPELKQVEHLWHCLRSHY